MTGSSGYTSIKAKFPDKIPDIDDDSISFTEMIKWSNWSMQQNRCIKYLAYSKLVLIPDTDEPVWEINWEATSSHQTL